MKRNILAMMVIAAAFGTAQAADAPAATSGSGDTGSEFFHQAGAGANELTGGLVYHLGSTVKAKGATPDADTKITGLQSIYAQYERGINEMFAVGGRLGYQSTTVDNGTSAKITGLQDLMIYLSGTNAMGTGNLKFGLGLGYGLAKGKVDATSGDMNPQGSGTTGELGGGIALTPYVGYDMGMGPGTLGARLSYGYHVSDRTLDLGGTDVKFKGGDPLGLAVFYEYMLTDMLLGADINYTSFTALKQTDAAGAETEAFKAHSVTGLDLYARIPVAGFQLIPAISYDFSATEFDKYNVMTLGVAGRWTL